MLTRQGEELEEEPDESAEFLSKESYEETDDDKNLKYTRSRKNWAVGGLSFTALLVITAEFAERCCYFAITAIYVVYSKPSKLHFLICYCVDLTIY